MEDFASKIKMQWNMSIMYPVQYPVQYQLESLDYYTAKFLEFCKIFGIISDDDICNLPQKLWPYVEKGYIIF